jgi:hypothetical protein
VGTLMRKLTCFAEGDSTESASGDGVSESNESEKSDDDEEVLEAEVVSFRSSAMRSSPLAFRRASLSAARPYAVRGVNALCVREGAHAAVSPPYYTHSELRRGGVWAGGRVQTPTQAPHPWATTSYRSSTLASGVTNEIPRGSDELDLDVGLPAGGEQQSVATPQAARGWAHPPCSHSKIQSCCCLGPASELTTFQTLGQGLTGERRKARRRCRC